MPTTRIAFACVLASCCLLSCNNKKDKSQSINQTSNIVTQTDTVQILADNLSEINDYCKDFTNSLVQNFSAESNRISVIKAAKGLRVTVDPSILEKEDGGKVNGKIDVSIIELTSGNDLFKSNAATISNGRLLASGGSYFIGMESEGKNLRIKNGKTMQIDFPVIAANEMELFYGERSNNNEMNWKKAGLSLQAKADEGLFNYNRDDYTDYFSANNYVKENKLTLFKSLTEKVYYYNRKMTLDELVDTINHFSKKVFLDTIYTWPKSLDTLPKGTWIDTNYMIRIYGPPKQYYLKTYKSLQDEKDRMARQQAISDSMLAIWKSQSLSAQIQKYYQPSGISILGWINCDRFYENKE